MKRFSIIILLFTAFTINTTAQTKRIAHRSHAGTLIAYANYEDDNLGLSPQMEFFYDSVFLAKKQLKDSLLLVTKDSISKNKVTPSKVKKAAKPNKIDTIKATPKTQPLPPNKSSEEGVAPKDEPKKSNLGLLFFIAVPVSFIAIISSKKVS